MAPDMPALHPLALAVLAALLLGMVSTFGDYVWAHWQVRHRVVYGLVHGAVICLCIGAVIGGRSGRWTAGLVIGPVVGVLAAAAFYVLAPAMGYSAMFPAWMLFWICFALLDARLTRGGSMRTALVRGLAAAVLSGAAFYLVSGMWTRPSRGGPNYPMHLLNWTFAFLPGFVALFWPVARQPTVAIPDPTS